MADKVGKKTSSNPKTPVGKKKPASKLKVKELKSTQQMKKDIGGKMCYKACKTF